jgi:deoxyadenosine/deoxycytidine kinase
MDFPYREELLFVLEGPIGIGKSTILQELEKRGYKIFPEPLHQWRDVLEKYYTNGQTKEDAIGVQRCINHSLLMRHGEIIEYTGKKIMIMERSLYSAISFAAINEEMNPGHEWIRIKRDLWEGAKEYESDKICHIYLHHNSFDELLRRTRMRNDCDKNACPIYLRRVYDSHLICEEEAEKVIDVTEKSIAEICDEFENFVERYIEMSSLK